MNADHEYGKLVKTFEGAIWGGGGLHMTLKQPADLDAAGIIIIGGRISADVF